MKQIAQYQDGRLELQEVPRPTAPPGGVLVRATHSVISVGTEKMKVEQAKMSLLQKARARPDQVRKVLDTARALGWRSAWEKVRNRLETPTPLGYSAAGVVVEVEPGNTRFRVGDRVACAGSECAFHAEYLAVPDLLTTPVPGGVSNWQAAYTTLCAIALHAVRQAEAAVGDQLLVVGQGLIGLLVTNLLRVAGARVMAVDLLAARKPFAEAMGAEKVIIPGSENLAEEVRSWTGGYGVDAAIVCTASQSNEPIEQAALSLRDKGRLVDVGITRIELPWKIFYEKELEVRFSRAYGPGRYDPAYEWAGHDYPIGHVRWTEQRNFQSCLHLMSTGQLNLAAVTTRRVPFDQAPEIYRELVAEEAGDIGVVLEYPAEQPSLAVPGKGSVTADRVPVAEPAREGQAGGIGRVARLESPVSGLDVVGAGNFARTMLLPHLQGRISLGTVVNQTALSANHVRTKFGFARAATDAAELWAGGEHRAVLIATRHHLHGPLVKAALEAGRQVFVEKPLCLNRVELGEIEAALETGRGTVQVGFNRRFAPASLELKRFLAKVSGPKTVSCRVMAGRLDPQHWHANYSQSGGRVLGETCHYLDYFCFLFDSPPVRVLAQTTWPASGRLPFPDSVSAQVEFADGSCGQLIHTAEGEPRFPKETLTVFAAGLVAEMTNFMRLVVHEQGRTRRFSSSSKGHAEQMEAWLRFLRGETEHPVPFVQARTSMLLTFGVLDSLQCSSPVPVIVPDQP